MTTPLAPASAPARVASPDADLRRLRAPRDLADIAAKVVARQRLSFDEGVRLYDHPDLLAVGRMADLVRERLHGDKVLYNVNRHIEPTNVCATACAFCAFGRTAADPLAYEMTLDEVYERAGACVAEGDRKSVV